MGPGGWAALPLCLFFMGSRLASQHHRTASLVDVSARAPTLSRDYSKCFAASDQLLTVVQTETVQWLFFADAWIGIGKVGGNCEVS